MSAPRNNTLPPTDDTPRWQVWGCLILMLAGLYLIAGDTIQLSTWRVTPQGNTALAEALAWHRGTLCLDRAFYEDVEVNGERYNIVGLAFVVLAYVGTAVSGWLGAPPEQFYPPLFVAVVALPLPFLGYWAFRTVVKSPQWSAVLTAYLITGTSLLPLLWICGRGSLYEINHALAVSGLLLLAGDVLGRRRLWPSIIGLCLAAWSRQMTCLYAVPLLWLAWRGSAQLVPEGPQEASLATSTEMGRISSPPQTHRTQRAFYGVLLGVLFVAAVPMTLNTLKFGSPLETGYQRLYDGREDRIARDAREQFYGPRYFLRHAQAMHVCFPAWDIRGGTLYAETGETDGGSIWLTSPLLLAVFLTWRRWWREPCRRALMLASFAVMLGLMGYHTTGAVGAGYYRYSLDFIPIWLLVIAPDLPQGRYGPPLTLACLAYSALYFDIIMG